VRLAYEQPAVPCTPDLQEALEQAAQLCGMKTLRLPSGATHDASAMADLCRIAMMFVRCRGGISHTPAEHVSDADLGAAVEATAAFLKLIAADTRPASPQGLEGDSPE